MITNSLGKLFGKVKGPQEKDTIKEVLGLELAKKGLKSEFLDRRIQGMKELNTLITKACPLAQTADLGKLTFLINWMQENGVFDIIWTPKNTHIELVKRSDDIIKQLVKHEKMTE